MLQVTLTVIATIFGLCYLIALLKSAPVYAAHAAPVMNY
jgi:hypothetical protein